MPYKMLENIAEDISFQPPAESIAITETVEAELKPHIVFLRRKNLAAVGGVQRLNSGIVDGLSHAYNIEQINWHGPEWGVPFYFPFFYFKSLRNGAGLVHCDDAVTSLVGARIRQDSNKAVIANVHGLDVILPIPWYQRRLRQALQSLDKIICISQATAKCVLDRGISPEKIAIIPGMAEFPSHRIERNPALYKHIESLTGIDLRDKKVLISLGRPVKRKGFDRFITDIFPHLSDDFVYIVAGPKLETPPWIKLARPALGKKLYHNLILASGSYGMHDDLIRLSRHPRVFYLNGVTDDLKERFLAVSDLFVMPNRTVEGDMEGFGLVAIEASIRGLPVVATGIEGITDAVIDGQNGFCIPEGDNAGMIHIISSLLDDMDNLKRFGEKAKEFTQKTFSPKIVTAKYQRLFDEVLLTAGKLRGEVSRFKK
jgi:glycosyltransferase involved in cell wall biosynthesis